MNHDIQSRSVEQYRCRCAWCLAACDGGWHDTREEAWNEAQAEHGWEMLNGRLVCGACVERERDADWQRWKEKQS